MTDRRSTPFNGRVAHVSLRGQVDAPAFTEGEAFQCDLSHVPILDRPDGARERELLCGQHFRVLEMPADRVSGHAYGFAERDGYCGYVAARFLHPAGEATHVVAVRETYRKATPDLKRFEPVFPLFLGSPLRVVGTQGPWSEIALPTDGRADTAPLCHFVPTTHLAPLGHAFADPATVAEGFLGTPYLWGGNTGHGIDCSGLVQAAMLACAQPCPGDSDQQEAFLGEPIGPDAERRRGDLWFWKGHVGILADAGTLIHANAHAMRVALEPLDAAMRRIASQGGGEVTSRRRITRPGG